MLEALPSHKIDRLLATVRCFARPLCWRDVAGAV